MVIKIDPRSQSPQKSQSDSNLQNTQVCLELLNQTQLESFDTLSNHLVVQIQSTLEPRNIQIIQQCVDKLQHSLNQYNVIGILLLISKCRTSPNGFLPSAPPSENNETNNSKESIDKLLNKLRHNCLLEIDKHANSILRSPDVTLLSFDDIYEICTRDTLQASREILVYGAIIRWAYADIAKKGLFITNENVRNSLKELLLAPRYGLMSKSEFTSRIPEFCDTPICGKLLNDTDWKNIKAHIKDKDKDKKVQNLPYKWSTPRCSKATPEIKENRRKSSLTSLDKVIINILTCWAAIFE